MALAEAIHPSGTLLGALFTLLLYGVAPLSLVLYLVGTPVRRKARRAAEAAADAALPSTEEGSQTLAKSSPETTSARQSEA
jgi:hypothetical protein